MRKDFFDKIDNNVMLDFKIEDNDGDEILIYPLVRYLILNELLRKSLKLLPAHSSKRRISNTKIMKYLYYTFKKNPYNAKQKDILVIGPAVGNSAKVENKYFNRIYDYYNLIFPDITLMLEDSYGFKYYEPRYFQNVYYRDYIKILIRLKSLKLKKHNQEAIEGFIAYLEKTFPSTFESAFCDKLKNVLTTYYKMIPHYKYHYIKLLEKLQPRIIFLNTASYGGLDALLVKIAKEIGIKAGEFQHGVITKSHPAYNYGEAVFKSEEYRKYLPNYLLTYGDYWNENMNTPVKKITIGNPHFWTNYEKYIRKEDRINNKKTILIVSQGTVTDITVKIAKELSKKINKEYQIVFRLHPGEVGFKERYEELYGYSNIETSKEGDIYDLIHGSDYIVSVYSTTIFEAASLNKTVFIYKHPLSELYIPKDIGIWFNTVDELYEMVKNNVKLENKYDVNYFWNKNWKENYINFIRNEIGIEVQKTRRTQ